MQSESRSEQLVHFFKIVGNESRLKVLGLLASDERSVGEMAILLGLSEPTVSHHLSVLRELDLVAMRVDGNSHIYWLHSEALEALNREVFSKANLAALAPEESGDAWEAKVLRYYVNNGQLRSIPAKQKKRQVVLRWLAEQLDPQHCYEERELSAELKKYHPDAAALRRHLTEFKLMARDEQKRYQRIAQ